MRNLHSDDSTARRLVGASTALGSGRGVREYLKALRQRFWLVFLLTLLVGGGGAIFTLVQRPVYYASSRILIEPPRAVVSDLNDDKADRQDAADFFNTRVQMITSRRIAERVLNALHLSDWDQLHGVADPVGELLGWIDVRPVKNSNLVDVAIEGNDPQLVAKIVNSTVEEFIRYEQESLQEFDQHSRGQIEAELRGLESQLAANSQAINDFHKKNENFLLNGESVEAARLAAFEQSKIEADARKKVAARAVERLEALREAGVPLLSDRAKDERSLRRQELQQIEEEIKRQEQRMKPEAFARDPFVRRLKERLDQLASLIDAMNSEEIEAELKVLQQDVKFSEMDVNEIDAAVARQRQAALDQQGEQTRLNALLAEQARLQALKDVIARTGLEVELRQGLVGPRIQIIDRAQPPREPIRPIFELQIPLFIAGGLLLGCGLAITVEASDRRLRRPEEASAALHWPLLGVIPHVARRELAQPNGALRPACEAPGSLWCEAFRNLRMGLLGAERESECRSLLVTSAKAGEGKSVVAANLATTLARAGESVLLIDVDLRRPALDKLFGVPRQAPGLGEALLGEAPWEKVVATTSVVNLSLLTAGASEGLPLDILGTSEMWELLARAREQFDRVILDCPPILGLADARVVARFVDGVLLVYRAGSSDQKPLDRVRQLAQLEGLRPIGVVFNGLKERHEDLALYRTAASAPRARSESSRSVMAAGEG